MIGTLAIAGPGPEGPSLDPPTVSKPRAAQLSRGGVAKKSLDLFLIHLPRCLASVEESSSCGELYGSCF